MKPAATAVAEVVWQHGTEPLLTHVCDDNGGRLSQMLIIQL